MTTSLHFWLRLSIWLLGLWGCIWLAGIVWRRRREKGLTSPIATSPEEVKRRAYTTVVNLAKIGLGVVLGMAAIDLWQYHHTYVVVNAIVDSQEGRIVAYHFADDPSHQAYAWHFCEDRFLPEFRPRQIVAKMQYVRTHDSSGECEDLSPGSASLRLRRINGTPILAGEGE